MLRILLLASLATLTLSTHVVAADSKTPATARKVVLDRTDGGAYRWKLINDAPVPKPGEHQVLLHVRAVSLNRGDLEQLEPGRKQDISGRIPASDAAGDVVAVGSQVKSTKVGARVTSTYFRNWAEGPPNREKMADALGGDVDGALADYIVLEEAGVVPIPSGLSYEEAATLPTAALTAFMATVGFRPELSSKDVVVVQGTGGVSTFAAQFAAATGARVIATSSSDEKLRKVRDLGVRDGINYKSTPEWSTKVLELTNGRGADLIVDVGGKDTLVESAKSVAYAGQISLVGGLTGYGGTLRAVALINRAARAQGVYVGSRADYIRMNAFLLKHRLHPLIERVVPIEQYDDALQLMRDSNFVGKIVLRL